MGPRDTHVACVVPLGRLASVWCVAAIGFVEDEEEAFDFRARRLLESMYPNMSTHGQAAVVGRASDLVLFSFSVLRCVRSLLRCLMGKCDLAVECSGLDLSTCGVARPFRGHWPEVHWTGQ